MVNGILSPRTQVQNAGEIFKNKQENYYYHFIYDYLIVEVSPKVFERDYSHRLKLRELLQFDETSPVLLER